MELSKADVYRFILPQRTLAFRRAERKRLSPEESARVTRMAKVFALAEETFQNVVKARAWLRRPNRALSGRAPLDLMDTESGARLVEDELTRLAYGVYA
jgi:putative toxin-antitoxin system antitoxin component (TIGR02293 family)